MTQESFNITSIHRDDVAAVFGKKAQKLSDDEMEWLARKMADDYCNQLFWHQIKYIGERIFSEKS